MITQKIILSEEDLYDILLEFKKDLKDRAPMKFENFVTFIFRMYLKKNEKEFKEINDMNCEKL